MPVSIKPYRSRGAFGLVELLVVLLIISVGLALLIPALYPRSSRAVEGDAITFGARLEYARLLAISKRTKTRILIAATNDWGSDYSWRAYVVASYDSTTGNWLQQGKFTRLSQSTTFDSSIGIVAARSTLVTLIVKAPNATPTPAPTSFTGAYIEFSPTGSTSLDPSATPEVVRIQDAFVPSSGTDPTPIRKNQSLHTDLSIDPVSGAMTSE